MRLWHYNLLPYLSKQWLMGQHRECCALRGKGWGRKHSTVDYVFEHPRYMLFLYHRSVISRLMFAHNVKIDGKWMLEGCRGKLLPNDEELKEKPIFEHYPEHDDEYFQACVDNLLEKQKQGKKPFNSCFITY